MINDVGLGAIEEAVACSLERQKRVRGDFFFAVGLPERYVVPLTKNGPCSTERFILQLGMAQSVWNTVSILNSLLSDGSWTMDVAISTEDIEYARYLAKGKPWGRYLDLEKNEKHTVSD